MKNTINFCFDSTNNNLKSGKTTEIINFVLQLGSHKAVAYMQPDSMDDEIDDLPDDFYELSIEEVRRLYHDLQQHRIELESTPLLSSSKREEIEKQVL